MIPSGRCEDLLLPGSFSDPKLECNSGFSSADSFAVFVRAIAHRPFGQNMIRMTITLKSTTDEFGFGHFFHVPSDCLVPDPLDAKSADNMDVTFITAEDTVQNHKTPKDGRSNGSTSLTGRKGHERRSSRIARH
jgi:hypothetical protein